MRNIAYLREAQAMKTSRLAIEWTDTGCVAIAEGFEGFMFNCPRCNAVLPSGIEHRCGDRLAPPLGKPRARKKVSPPCIDCGEGPCYMNCGPAIERKR